MTYTKNIRYDPISTNTSHPQVRLITIEDSDDETAPVKCKINTAVLDADCHYAALSYVWNDPPGSTHIYVHGEEIEVPSNLEAGLRHVRDGTAERVLWVDYLSINQADLAERSSQVMMMGQIFGRADKVIGWLGPAVAGGEAELASLDVSELDRSFQEMEMQDPESKVIEHRFLTQTLDEQSQAALNHIAASNYWTRTWILQEVALAKDPLFLYGFTLLPWSLFQTLTAFYTISSFNPALSLRRAPSPGFDTVEAVGISVLPFSMTRQRYQGKNELGILGVVRTNASLKASDPRDKIYGFCGLARDAAQFVKVDYTKSTSEVYELFARGQVEQLHSLNIILAAGTRESSTPELANLPSWAPDWSREMAGSVRASPLYTADRSVPHTMSGSCLPGILRARSVKCDTVQMFQPKLSFWASEDLLFSRGPFDHPSGLPRLQAFLRTVTGDRQLSSGIRFGENDKGWFYHNSMGYLLSLGMQTDHTSDYAREAFGDTSRTTQVTRGDDDWHRYDFIRAFRDWARACVTLLDDMIQRRHVPMPDEDGTLNSPALNERVPMWHNLGVFEREQVVEDPSHLIEWREELNNVETAPDVDTTLRLFFGKPGNPKLVPGLGNDIQLRENHGATCWGRFYHNAATLGGQYPAFTTTGGYIGVGPKVMRAGDELHVLAGCCVPVMLRPVGDKYSVLGGCSVYGLMDGEAMDSVDAGTRELREIDLI